MAALAASNHISACDHQNTQNVHSSGSQNMGFQKNYVTTAVVLGSITSLVTSPQLFHATMYPLKSLKHGVRLRTGETFPTRLNCDDLSSQGWHSNDFSSKWIREWISRSPASVNFLQQNWHANDFSPEWVRKCILRLPACENLLVHCWHEYGLSPEWVRKCVLRLTACENLSVHCWQA